MQLKKDPFVLGLAALVLFGLGFLVYKGKLTWELAIAGAALFGLPSVFGKSNDDDPPPPPKAPILPVLIFSLVMGCSGHEKSVANATDLAGYAAALEVCKAEGKDAGALAVYEACAKEADRKYGRKDGGS